LNLNESGETMVLPHVYFLSSRRLVEQRLLTDVGMPVTFNECPLLTAFLPMTAPTE
jgi:hypothetical protein